MRKKLCVVILCLAICLLLSACGQQDVVTIVSAGKVSSEGLTDTYCITLSDGREFYFDVTNGTDGLSAYEIALNNGFKGSESEWLDSLKGEPGEKGEKGENGVGIKDIKKTGETDLAHIYTLYLTDNREYTFEIPKVQNDENIVPEGMLSLNDLGADYSPSAAGDALLEEAITVTAEQVKGAHDSNFVIIGNKAYIVYEANDVQPGENSEWDYVYCAMSIVNIRTGEVEEIVKFSQNMQRYQNETLPHGCTFVPRIVRKDENTLRVFFASEDPGVRQSLTYYIDYDLAAGRFDDSVYRLKLKTPSGEVDFTPAAYYEQAIVAGHNSFNNTNGAFLFDIFEADGKTFIALNNFANGQNALARFNDAMDCVEIIGHIGEGTQSLKTTESGIMRKNDGTWMAALREERSGVYRFSYSDDGINWSYPRIENFARTGTASKPTLDNFNGHYFMSWADSSRSCMRFMYSTDAVNWTDIVTVYSPTTFQYPSFVMYENHIYFTATAGDKESIIFGKMPIEYVDGQFYATHIQPSETEMFFSGISGWNRYTDIIVNSNGTVYDAYVKRDSEGAYFKALSTVANKGDKIFFMLDLEGKATNFTPSNFMFKFQGGDLQYQGYYQSGRRGYKNFAFYEQIKFMRKTYRDGASELALFVPYSAFGVLAPECTVDKNADMYFTVYGANGSFISDSEYGGHKTVWDNPSTYLILTADNKIIA